MPHTGTLTASLYITGDKLKPLKFVMGKISFLNAAPGLKPEIKHKFRADDGTVSEYTGIIGSILVMLPFLWLVNKWRELGLNLSIPKNHAAVSFLFLAGLVACFMLLSTYWVALNLLQLLKVGIPLGGFTVFWAMKVLQSKKIHKK